MLKDTAGSLHEELQQLELFYCEICGSAFESLDELDTHRKTSHSDELKLDNMSQIANFELKLSEQKANGKEYCRINHHKYNFVKSRSDELFAELKKFSELDKSSNVFRESSFGAKRKFYTCNVCDRTFSKQGEFKKHMRSEHREKREDMEM